MFCQYIKTVSEVCMGKKFMFALGVVLATAQAFGAVYYVAPDGNDSNAGSEKKPFATLNKANKVVSAGDTVWIRGGIYDLHDTVFYERYKMTAGILLTASGESDDNRIYYLAYPGERPIFDATNLPVAEGEEHSDGTPEGAMYTSPFVIAAKYLHLKGFEVRNTPMIHNSNSGIFIYASKHIFLEQIDSHHNAGPGFFAHDGASGGGGHLFLNCDAHDNYDPTDWQGDGENADGFGVHYQYDGDTTKFVGCRAWWNSDDGYDVLAQEFPVVVENSYAMGNGYIHYGTSKPPNGNGNGFKMGYSRNDKGRHIIKNCVAWNNVATGFYSNYTAIGSTWINNTSYKNGDRSFGMPSTIYAEDERTRIAEVVPLMDDKAHVLKNNIAFPNKLSQIGTCWEKISSQDIDHYVDCPAGENNTWNFDLDLTEDDFVSLDDPSMTVTGEDLSTIPGMLGPRNADGSLPEVDFLKLKKGSRAIDQGEDVGLPFAGKAPDLGAFEYGKPASSSVAKSSSSAGKSSSSARKSSSSSKKSSAIAMQSNVIAGVQGPADVFDMQGRYLGTLPAETLRGDIAEALRAQFHVAGIYLVRSGEMTRQVSLK